MGQTRIHIDQLSIQSKGVSSSVAQGAIAGLGQEVITALSQQATLSRSGTTIQIHQLSLDTIKVSDPDDARSLQHAIAAAIAQAVAAKLNPGNGR